MTEKIVGLLIVVVAAMVVPFAIQGVAHNQVQSWRHQRSLIATTPVQIANFQVAYKGTRCAIESPERFAPILAGLQSVGTILSHHSHPTNPVEIVFDANGKRHIYFVGRDSERPNEFWVFTDHFSGIPIGRFQSDTFGYQLFALLAPQETSVAPVESPWE